MRTIKDIFDDPVEILQSGFDPRDYSFLGIKIGDRLSDHTDWPISERNEYGWHFLEGGVRFRVTADFIEEIALPKTFLHRLGISEIKDLILAIGEPEDTRDTVYRGRVTLRSHIWNRGFIVWSDEPEGICSHVAFYDPSKPAPKHEGV